MGCSALFFSLFSLSQRLAPLFRLMNRKEATTDARSVAKSHPSFFCPPLELAERALIRLLLSTASLPLQLLAIYGQLWTVALLLYRFCCYGCCCCCLLARLGCFSFPLSLWLSLPRLSACLVVETSIISNRAKPHSTPTILCSYHLWHYYLLICSIGILGLSIISTSTLSNPESRIEVAIDIHPSCFRSISHPQHLLGPHQINRPKKHGSSHLGAFVNCILSSYPSVVVEAGGTRISFHLSTVQAGSCTDKLQITPSHP